ncbi:hypothetical protein ANTQUA_LOCUS1504 [Anthophora quadrimaculata]
MAERRGRADDDGDGEGGGAEVFPLLHSLSVWQSEQDGGEYAEGSAPVGKDAFDPVSPSHGGGTVMSNRYCA